MALENDSLSPGVETVVGVWELSEQKFGNIVAEVPLITCKSSNIYPIYIYMNSYNAKFDLNIFFILYSAFLSERTTITRWSRVNLKNILFHCISPVTSEELV